MEPRPDQPARRAFFRLHKPLSELILESGMIVLSVLLALAASSWADRRKQNHLAEQARSAFVLELRNNRALVARAIPYHDALSAAVLRADSTDDVRTYAQWRRAFPAWSGFAPPDLTFSAWQTAVSTGAIGDIPFGTVGMLSRAYTVQGRLDAFNTAFFPVLDFSDERMHGTVRRMRVYVSTVLSYERYLLTQYDSCLVRLEPPGR